MQNDREDWEGLCAFFRRSSYDLIQPRTGDTWGEVWTFERDSVSAAQRAGWLARKLYGARSAIRYARRDRIEVHAGQSRPVVVIWELPEGHQTVLDVQTGDPVTGVLVYEDERFLALRTAVGHLLIAGVNESASI